LTTQTSFASLGLAEPLLRAVTETGYTTPTPIQAQAIPQVLKGGDLLAAAQTGTGKTAGFALPVLHRLLQNPLARKAAGRPRCLILTPTRELAAQIEESVRTYSRHVQVNSLVIFGGVNINPQISALRKPVDILVATPGRLLDHAQQKTVDLSGVEILVLDEADRMLDMGFIRDIRRVLALLPKSRQNLLFSATFSDDIRKLSRTVLNNPQEISVAPRNTTSELVAQSVVLTEQAHKRDLLSFIIRESGWHQVLVFTRTKHGANRLAEKLNKDGLVAAAIHGNKSQAARTRALAGFKEAKVSVLVATDIAARGLDIEQLPMVINHDLPMVAEDYVHRIGRTGRAGVEGHALSLVDDTEAKYLKAIEKLINMPIERTTIAGWSPDMVKARPAGEEQRGATSQRDAAGRQGAGRNQARKPGTGRAQQRNGGHARPESSRRSAPAPHGHAQAGRPHASATTGHADSRQRGNARPAPSHNNGTAASRPAPTQGPRRAAPQRAALLAK
jgi:ATP-dependent RNA helicase RhlE